MFAKKILLGLFIVFFVACKEQNTMNITSPNTNIEVRCNIDKKGAFYYQVLRQNKTIIDKSFLGFSLENKPDLVDDFKVISTATASFSEKWRMVWGEQEEVENTYQELTINLQEQSGLERKLTIVFRVYNDGIGFRYEFPKQKNMDEVLIAEELTEFQLPEDTKTWWTPGDWEIYEHLYRSTLFSKINAFEKEKQPLAQTYIPHNAVNTPVTIKMKNGIHLSFHEAALVGYSGMTLKVDTTHLKMTSCLVGSQRTTYKVKRNVPFHTPWRTIQIAEKATDLIDSKLIVNLNEPNKLGNISWFQPTKYTGIWWDMHLGGKMWDFASGKHGATTDYAKRMIDFSAKNNIKALLVEGWNTGWEEWVAANRNGIFDFVTPYPDYNLEEVVSYGRKKGVRLIMHHETSGDVVTYSKQQDTAFTLMKKLGINAVKTGYVGTLLPKGEYHHGQFMVNHYNDTYNKAAQYQIAINAHEPIKATGLRRTYPNMISREGLRGQEFNAWAMDGGNPPEHLSIVAFTRMLAGPIDFTPGIFDIKFDKYKKENQVNTTLAHQLALYVVIYSPIQMVPDLIENYEQKPDAFQFIKDVGVNWKVTKVLNGEVGDFVTIARKERETDNWFVGGITDENQRVIHIDFDFLDENSTYEARFYVDGENAHWDKNPTDIKIFNERVSSKTHKKIRLAAGGGFAISLKKYSSR